MTQICFLKFHFETDDDSLDFIAEATTNFVHLNYDCLKPFESYRIAKLSLAP